LLKRVLLDECVPKRLRSELIDHVVETVTEKRWNGIKNGQLLRLAALEFDCFLTVDRNLQFQQPHVLPIAVLVLLGTDNKFETLRTLINEARTALKEMQPCELRRVGI
jgi:hypothetical protein